MKIRFENPNYALVVSAENPKRSTQEIMQEMAKILEDQYGYNYGDLVR